jgi:predicted nucleic acid-binding protein
LKTYLDSSFLFSLYVNDANSQAAFAEMARVPSAYVISSLAELEFLNALELWRFRKQLLRSEAEGVRGAFEQDLERAVYTLVELDPRIFRDTRKLILQFSASVGCRTADILHVSAALASQCGRMFTFDLRQRDLARRVKLPTN